MLDFSVQMSVQYTLNTLYVTRTHNKCFQKPIDPLSNGIIKSFFIYFKKREIKLELIRFKSQILFGNA